MGKNATVAIAIVLCVLVVIAVIAREKCRLGSLDWQVCSWLQTPDVHIGPIR